MRYTLGIDVGVDVTTAVMISDGGRITPLQLGHGRLATGSAVLRADDGSTTVGDAALEAGPDPITDPVGVLAASGDPLALQAVVAHVLGRAAAAAGEPPDLVGITHPGDWDLAARNRLVEVVRSAGASEVVAVDERVAARQPFDGDPAIARAAGAAVAAASGVGPIVTRADLGADLPPVAPAPPVSVFDGIDDGSDPAPPEPPAAEGPPPAPAPHDEPTVVMPVVRPTPVSRAAAPLQRRQIAIVAGVAVIALVAIVALSLMAGFGSGGDSAETVPSSTVTTTSIVTTTTPTTSSTTSTSTTSTTSTSTTSTTSTSSTSTTTVPQPVGSPGPVTLVETGLVLDTGSVLRFGDDSTEVLDEISAALGQPDSDSGYAEEEFCFSTVARFVHWGELEVVMAGDDEATASFGQWFVDGADDPNGLVTIDGLGVGATVGFLEVNYGSALQIAPAFEGSEAGLFAVTNRGNGATLVGVTDSLEPEGVVQQMWAGDECTRVFT